MKSSVDNLARLYESGWQPPQPCADPIAWQKPERNLVADWLCNYSMDHLEDVMGFNLLVHSDGAHTHTQPHIDDMAIFEKADKTKVEDKQTKQKKRGLAYTSQTASAHPANPGRSSHQSHFNAVQERDMCERDSPNIHNIPYLSETTRVSVSVWVCVNV